MRRFTSHCCVAATVPLLTAQQIAVAVETPPYEVHADVDFMVTMAARFAALHFATFDAGGDAMEDGGWGEAANGAFFRNFLSGMS
jgi:hypothetical protein